MAKTKVNPALSTQTSLEESLKELYTLQTIDSKIDKIRILQGELPLEVQDLEDEITGLETRINNCLEEIDDLKEKIKKKKNEIVDSEALIKKYQEQQLKVRNNREYDSLSKEIEFQTLEIQLNEKRIKEFTEQIQERENLVEESKKILDDRKTDLKHKKSELEEIIKENRKEEEDLAQKSEKLRQKIEPRLLRAYERIRNNVRNRLAVVTIERDACGGCFNRIPPQRQLDIRARLKIIICEYCGRILVDNELTKEVKKRLN